MTAPCTGLFGRLLGHKYQPLYNTIPPKPEAVQQLLRGGFLMFPDDQRRMVQLLTRRERVGALCARCGQGPD